MSHRFMTLLRRLSHVWRGIKWSFEARPKLTFTREGQLFSLTTIGLGVAATNSGNNLLYLILGMMLSLILSSGVLSSLNLHRLRIRRRVPSRVTAGEPFNVELILQNVKRAWPSMGVRVSEPLWSREGQEGRRATSRREIYCFKIDPSHEELIRYEGLCEQRGRYLISGARVVTSFPFGLFQKSIGLSARATMRAYPRVDRAPELLEAPSHGPNSQARRARAHGGDRGGLPSHEARDELIGLRPLSDHEPLKLIHWRASAKRGELIRARYGSGGQAVSLVWVNAHFAQGLSAPTSEEADEWANLVASVCNQLFKLGDLQVNVSDRSEWRVRSRAQLLQLFEWLIDASLSPHEGSFILPPQAYVVSHPSGERLLEGAAGVLLLSPRQGGGAHDSLG